MIYVVARWIVIKVQLIHLDSLLTTVVYPHLFSRVAVPFMFMHGQ